jgi:hypothetical protein
MFSDKSKTTTLKLLISFALILLLPGAAFAQFGYGYGNSGSSLQNHTLSFYNACRGNYGCPRPDDNRFARKVTFEDKQNVIAGIKNFITGLPFITSSMHNFYVNGDEQINCYDLFAYKRRCEGMSLASLQSRYASYFNVIDSDEHNDIQASTGYCNTVASAMGESVPIPQNALMPFGPHAISPTRIEITWEEGLRRVTSASDPNNAITDAYCQQPLTLKGDINGDGCVSMIEIAYMARAYRDNGDMTIDFDNNGVVDDADIAMVWENYEVCYTVPTTIVIPSLFWLGG